MLGESSDNAVADSVDIPGIEQTATISNRKLWSQTMSDLRNRRPWEDKLARMHLQRHGLDRNTVNNVPWPRASNIRFMLSDMFIERKKPLYFRIIFNSENIFQFKALIQENVPFAVGCAHYYDFVCKQKTDLEEELLFCIDCLLQWGETYVKITWDDEKEVPCFQQIDPLFIIAPSTATSLRYADRFTHVIQLSKQQIKEKYAYLGKEKLKQLMIRIDDPTSRNHDQSNQEQNEYDREGVSRSGNGKPVLWEVHYHDAEGKKRLRTVAPDYLTFDFEDDRLYDDAYNDDWMVVQIRRELTNKNLHSSRGICEVVSEFEYSLTSMWRSKHNAMTLYNAPIFHTAGGPPGSTNNESLIPGAIMPFKLERVDMGSPPISWDIEMENTQKYAEGRMAIFDTQIAEASGNNRTAKEVSAIENQQGLSLDLETGIWKRGIKKVGAIGWRLICAHRPKSLMYYINNDMQELSPDAINSDYQLSVSGSAENINKEWMLQKAMQNFEIAKGNPFVNLGEVTKHYFEVGSPGSVQRFYTNPQEQQYKNSRKAFSDISLMMDGFTIVPESTDDHFVCAKVAHDFVQQRAAMSAAQQQAGLPVTLGLTGQQSSLINNYLNLQREALQKTNKKQYEELNKMLDQTDKVIGQQLGLMNNSQGEMPVAA